MPNITFSRQTTLTFPGSQISDITSGIVNGSLVIREVLCSDRLAFGDINSNQFQCQLYDCPNLTGKKIQVIQSDNGTDKTLFTGWVDSCKTDDLSGFKTIVAYDYFYKARKKKIKAWWKSYWSSREQSTIGAMWKNLLSYYNISYTDTTLICDGLTVQKKQMKKIKTSTLSSFLSQLSEINMCVPNMSRTGALEFKQFTSAAISPSSAIDIQGYYTISKSKFEEVAITPYNKIELYTKNNELGAEAGSGSNVLVIQNNVFLFNQGADWLQTVADYMLNGMYQFNYYPANITMKVSSLDIKLGDLVQTQKGLCLVCENNYTGSLLVDQQLVSNYQSEYDEPNAGTTLGNMPIRDMERLEYNVDEKSSIIAGPEIPDLAMGQDGDLCILTAPPVRIERYINNSPYWYATQLKQNSNGKYDITVTGYSDDVATPSTANAPVKFKAIGFGGAGTYHIKCKMQFTGYSGNFWGCNNLGIYISYDDTGIYFGQTMSYGTLTTTMYNTFLLNTFNDTNEHEYSFDFTIDAAHGSQIQNKTMYLAIVMDRCWKYYNSEPVGYAEGTLTIKDLQITGENVVEDTKIYGVKAKINGNWENINYVDEVSQTQGETGGTEIAEINNTNGTKTKIYQKTVTPNPVGEASETLEKLTIGSKIYNLGGGVDDYDELENRPKVNNVTLTGNKTSSDLGIVITLTQAEYNALTTEEKNDLNKVYYISDAGGGGGGGGASAISELTDVELTDLTDGEILKYDATEEKWVNAEDSGGGDNILVPTPFIYSETEEQVGIWIDGKPLYAKTKSFTNVSKSGSLSFGVANAETAFIKDIGKASDSIPIPYIHGSVPSNNIGGFLTKTSSDVTWEFRSGNDAPSTLSGFMVLFYTKTTDTAWQGGFKAYGFSPIIYSETEREVGVWIDGKPLYAKTINVAPLPNSTDKRVAHGISNLDKFISVYGYAISPNINSIPLPFVNATSASAQVGIITDTSDVIIRARDDRSTYTNAYVTLYYTKTTDTAGSGKYTTLGTPTVHYDGEERVIGTWFGETLYQKTIVNSSGISSLDTWTEIADVGSGNNIRKATIKIETSVGDIYDGYQGQGATFDCIINMSSSVTKTLGKVSAILGSESNWLRNLPITLILEYTKTS